MIQTILFDFDGTLFDTGEGILRSVQYALEGFGIHETDTARLRKFVGPPLFDSFSELYAMTPEQAQAAVARYRERYLPVGIYECTLYPGIPELLEQLRAHGFRVAVATGKPTPMACSILQRFDLERLFDCVIGCEYDGTRSTKAEVVAAADADVLEQRLGKGGRLLHAYANGYDPAPVHCIADLPPPKSIGNSATAPRDLICEADARAALLSLAESVGARLRLEGYQCRTVELSVRTADLHWRSHRMALRHPSDLTSELLDAALALCEQAHLWPDPLRSIGIRALDLVPACAPHQLDLFEDAEHRARQRQLDITLDNLRARYGKTCVLRGRACFDPALGLVQREEHAFLRK